MSYLDGRKTIFSSQACRLENKIVMFYRLLHYGLSHSKNKPICGSSLCILNVFLAGLMHVHKKREKIDWNLRPCAEIDEKMRLFSLQERSCLK